MNLGKAREYFSAYYEGSLERGLKQSFEARLSEDAQLQAEYKAFVRTMTDLESLGQQDIEPPFDLHERIAARLDKAIWEEKRQKAPTLGTTWWKGLVMGATVAAGIFIAFIGFNRGFRSVNAGTIPTVGSTEQFAFASHDHSVMLSYPAVDHRTVTIQDGKGRVWDTEDLNGQSMNAKPLVNESDSPILLSVVATESGVAESQAYVAIPGKIANPSTSGKGTLGDLAMALAGHFGSPVVVQSKEDIDKAVSWDFGNNSLLDAATSSIQALGLAAQQQNDHVLVIQKH